MLQNYRKNSDSHICNKCFSNRIWCIPTPKIFFLPLSSDNPEELMTMHTDAFRIAEENTVKYMCEEQQKEIAELRRSGEEKDKINAAQQKELEEKNKINRTQQNQIVVQQNQINEQQSQIREQQSQIDELRKQLEALQAVITSAT